MTAIRQRAAALGGLLAIGLLLVAAPTPSVALRRLGEPDPAGDGTAPLVALLSLLAWALASWLLLAVLLSAGTHLPGRRGRTARALARRLVPAVLRRALEVALGLSAITAVAGAAPAVAAPGPATSAAAPWLDRSAPGPDLDWAAVPPPVPAAPDPRNVRVQPGDSLWSITARDLTGTTGGPPSDAEVANLWPAWWAANRDAIGADPDLIRPGLLLSPPDSPASPSPIRS